MVSESKQRDPGLAIAINYFGGRATVLARALGVTDQAVSQWEVIPTKQCIRLEEITGGALTRYGLRPDHFGRIDAAREASVAQDNAA